jgi:hypothetical protein
MVIYEQEGLLTPYYLVITAVLVSILGRSFADFIQYNRANAGDTNKEITRSSMVWFTLLYTLVISALTLIIGLGWGLQQWALNPAHFAIILAPIVTSVLLIGAIIAVYLYLRRDDENQEDAKTKDEILFSIMVTVSGMKKVLVVMLVSITVCIMRGWSDMIYCAIVALLLVAVCIFDTLGQLVFHFHAESSDDQAKLGALESVRMFSWFVNFFVVISLWVMNFPQYGDESAHSSMLYTILLLYIAVSTLISDCANEYKVMIADEIVSFRLAVDDMFIVVIGFAWSFHYIQVNQ